MKITFADILIEAYDRKNIIGFIFLILLFIWIGINSCVDQENIDKSNATCRGVIVSQASTPKGTVTKLEFTVDGEKYKGSGGNPSRVGSAVVGDSVYVKYVLEDPSVNQLMYSPEYSYPPSENAGRDRVIFISVVIVSFALMFFLFIKYGKKKEDNSPRILSN